MLIRGVIWHEIKKESYASCMQLLEDLVKVAQRAITRVDRAKIRNVVAEIEHRRRVHRCKPNYVGAKPFDVIELLQNSAKIASPVPICISEGDQGDFVYNGMSPPFRIAYQFPVGLGVTRLLSASPNCHGANSLGDGRRGELTKPKSYTNALY